MRRLEKEDGIVGEVFGLWQRWASYANCSISNFLLKFSVVLAFFFNFCANATRMGKKIALMFSVASAQFPAICANATRAGRKKMHVTLCYRIFSGFLGVFSAKNAVA
jgi:hypothetical protein